MKTLLKNNQVFEAIRHVFAQRNILGHSSTSKVNRSDGEAGGVSTGSKEPPKRSGSAKEHG